MFKEDIDKFEEHKMQKTRSHNKNRHNRLIKQIMVSEKTKKQK